MADFRNGQWLSRTWPRALVAAVLFAPLLALAGTDLEKRIIGLRDQIRLSPDRALFQLLDLQSRNRTGPPRRPGATACARN